MPAIANLRHVTIEMMTTVFSSRSSQHLTEAAQVGGGQQVLQDGNNG